MKYPTTCHGSLGIGDMVSIDARLRKKRKKDTYDQILIDLN